MMQSATIDVSLPAPESEPPTPPSSLLPALGRIAEFAGLPENWDGEGACPPSPRAVAAACLLIEAVAESGEQATGQRPAPSTSAPIADGGLQLEWLSTRARIDVEVGPDGTFAYMIKRGSGAHETYEEASEIDWKSLLALIAHVLA